MAAFSGFPKETLHFLEELDANNDREWFKANKERYQSAIVEPVFRFIKAFAPKLVGISPHYVAKATKVGGSMTRIYRDIRFSKNKTPFHTHIGIVFKHADAKTTPAPGIGMHISLDRCSIGAGLWAPKSDVLNSVRQRIDSQPNQWNRVVNAVDFRRHLELGGASLTRPPKGYSADHPLIDVLKKKEFFVHAQRELSAIHSPDFIDDVESTLRVASPFVEFLCKAVGARY